jgi:molecular chaperone IbpA
VAGFKQEHIDIEVKDHILSIKGDRPARREQTKYVHKGISARNWKKSFRLSEYTEVTGADLTDGILTVNLEVVLPDEKLPRKISIGKNEVKNGNHSAELLAESP